MNLQLTAEEQKILRETLQRSVRDLDLEILHTDSHQFKDMLKHRKAALDGLLRKLEAAAVPA